jgi:nucleotide-binding universal stress UspA family protein
MNRSLNDGPILFMTGDLRASKVMPALATFAHTTGRGLEILLRMPARTEPVIFKKRIEMHRESLPDELKQIPLKGLHPNEIAPALQTYASNGGGIIALNPIRRGNPGRMVFNNDYERLLIDGPLPVLVLPRSGALGSIKRVLFPADLSPRSEAAFDQTIAFCQQVGAELHLLHVYGPDGLLPSEQDREQRLAAPTPRALFQIDQDAMRRLIQRASEADLTVTSANAEGRAHTQILAYSAAQQIDLVVMATHGPRSADDILWGTTTHRVILAGTVAVIGIQA